ncbi:hypothetical protein BURK2_02832 [Burkholderiales bacterium]|nr:hypothetical protein BURK2_02832 [Burkholderiales bacterium]
MGFPSRERLAEGVIFSGLLVNALFIGLILYLYVF